LQVVMHNICSFTVNPKSAASF